MNMEEFRKGLESEAREENERLKKKIAILEKEKAAMVHDMECLSNRCFALTGGTMCDFCTLDNKFQCYRQKEKKVEDNHHDKGNL